MSDRVELHSEGLRLYRWDCETRSEVESIPEDPVVYLRDRCVVAEGTTLGDVLRWVHSEPELEHFLARYSWCRAIEAFAFEAALDPDEPDDGSIEYLEVYWHAVWHDRKNGSFDLACDFHGVGKVVDDDPAMGMKKGDPITWSVSYTPVNNIAHLPLRLCEELKVSRLTKQGAVSAAIESRRSFTLLEVLDAILWDISFAGGPEEKAEFLEDLNERAREAREEIEGELDSDS